MKTISRRFFAISITSFAMALVFTGCGKGGGKDSDKGKTPEYVYESEFNDLGTAGVDYVSKSIINNGNIYMTGSHYEEDKKNGTGKSINYIMTSSLDRQKIDMAEIKGLKKDEYPSNLLMDEEGNILMVSSVYNYNEKTNTSNTKYFILNIDKNGKLSGRTELKPGLKKNEEFYLSSSVIYANEKFISISERDRKVYIFNKDGSLDKTVESDNYIDNIFKANNGKIYIMGSMTDSIGMCVCELDIKAGKFGEPLDLGGNVIYNVKNTKHGKDGIVYLCNDEGLYEFDINKNKSELLFNWINVDINGNDVSDFQMAEDGNLSVLCTSYNYDSSGNGSSSSNIELASIAKKKYSESAQKKRLTLAANYLSQELKDEVLKYNRDNKDYHIDVKSYSMYEDPQKQMNLDIISGDVPDIMEMGGLSKPMYIKKGILADISGFIENDDEIKKEDFVDSVISTIENDGKLYYLPATFSIVALAGPKEVFNGMEGWTYEEMEEIYNNMPEGGVFMQNMTSEWFIQNMLTSQMKDFINFETGEVNLNSKEFIHMLEFSKNFQTSDQYMKEMEENGWKSEDISELIKKKKLLLNNMYLYDFSDIQVNEQIFKNRGGFVVVSQPSKDKNNKLSMSTSMCLAISEKCDDKENAWKFLRRLYLYDYQKKASNNGSGFPVRKDVLEKKIEYAMATKEYTDDDGTKVTPEGDSSYSMNDFTVNIKPYTKAHMDLFRSMVDRIGKEDTYDTFYTDISKMLEEETKAFFAGDKTAEETAEVLQSRVKIYVSENS
ncbi:MAG: extracellular solute-binding protein [Lachnospiraceae bacterium]|nr:extracellular solute-binding protein [Lachnospiraceae bacterium]